MQTKQDFMNEAELELGNDFKDLIPALDNEYYELLEAEVKNGNTITQAVYESLSEGQRFHFNKHYNYRNDKVVANNEPQQLEVTEELAEVNAIINDQIEVNEVIETKVNNKTNVTKIPKKEMFYWFNSKENMFIEAYGKKVNIEGYKCFILENDNNTYSIVEAKTGSFLSSHIKTKKAAIEEAKTMVNRYTDKMDELIQNSINKIGMSPLYKAV